MEKDRTVQPHDIKAKDILRAPAALSLFGFIGAVGASGIWHLWQITVENGVPFLSGVKVFALIIGCIATNGILAWIITESWKKG